MLGIGMPTSLAVPIGRMNWENRLADFEWLDAIQTTDVNGLIAEFDYLDDLDWLRLIRNALRLSAHVLAVDPGQLPSQLVGRLRIRKWLSETEPVD